MAFARTWAVNVCLIISNPSSDWIVMIETEELSGSSSRRSLCSPFTTTATALLASPAPIDLARSRPFEPFSSSFTDPSGKLISIQISNFLHHFNSIIQLIHQYRILIKNSKQS